MGRNGLGPRPYTARHARTLFVRVPVAEWPEVKRGYKREFRGTPGKQSALLRAEMPRPVVAYCLTTSEIYDTRLMLLEALRLEEVGAISDESLRREGFGSFEEFRRAWMRRNRNGQKFRPTQKVFVYSIRPWEPKDRAEMGEAILQHLYGDFLP
jgi:hypothetical protein